MYNEQRNINQSPVADRTYLHCRQQPITANHSMCGACGVNCATRRVPLAALLFHKQHTRDNIQCTIHKIQQTIYMAGNRPNSTCTKPSSTKWNNLLSMKKKRHSKLKLRLKYTKGLSWSTAEVEFVLQQKVEVEVQQRTTCGSDNDAASPFNLCPLLLTVGGDVLLSILLTAVLYFHISSCYLLLVVFAGVIKARVI